MSANIDVQSTSETSGKSIDPRVELANTWLSAWRESHPTSKWGVSTLRAYNMWHHQALDVAEVALICSTRPIAERTVASYILTMIKDEDVAYDREKAKELLTSLPSSVHGRYTSIVVEDV